ncbi:hypothetical protein N44_04676 [Microcystis aeruginosa NIES-44]|uniref:Uncharacterized protein n=1 Tax=Microcystis aeruginosa NIES-44 TaxID=449439 RepID=A0A0A1W1G8_MICAE|nr:hypothetical protein N44_04676 [Microcystis aeruginosa NIES-44]
MSSHRFIRVNYVKKPITPPDFVKYRFFIDSIGVYLCFSSPENGFL